MPADSDGTFDGDLLARLETGLPERMMSGEATALFLAGWCFHRRDALAGVELVVGTERYPADAARMPRPDVRAAAAVESGGDAFRSGFWATVPVTAPEAPRTLEVALEARLAGGGSARAQLGEIEVVDKPRPALRPGWRGEDLIAVCMATYEPPADLLAVQLDSLRAQTHANWICLISDDCSSPEGLARIEAAIGGDERFVLSASERRLGFYRNFERALAMAPPDARLVALCDQDDRWHPDKLATLRAAIGDAQLAYSDQRLVGEGGEVIADTLWEGRRNNFTNLASMLVANTVTGAATLMRREVVERALPFPNQPGWQFHDHWLALVALAAGDIVYVDRPLYDYVQHRGAILGQVAAEPLAGEARPGLVSRFRERLRAWRPAYFCGYTRLAVQARTLLMRCDGLLTKSKRGALERFVAADRSPLAFAWLAGRPLRRLAGHGETLGAEAQLARGILWRRTVGLRAPLRRPHRFAPDASIPPCGPDSFGQKRLRRWRAGTPRRKS